MYSLLEAYDELNRICEDDEIKYLVEFSLSDIKNSLTEDTNSEVNNLVVDEIPQDNSLAELVQKIKDSNGKLPVNTHTSISGYNILELAKKVVGKFSGSGKDSKWAYQLQLLCNAYIAESEIINKLNNAESALSHKLFAKISELLKTDKYSWADSIQNNFSFKFGDTTHTAIYTDTSKRTAEIQRARAAYNKAAKKDNTPEEQVTSLKNTWLSQIKDKSDIHIMNNSEDTTMRIEIKVTKNGQPKNFYGAEIVLICDLGSKTIYPAFKDNDGKYQIDKENDKLGSIEELLPGTKFIKVKVNQAIFNLDKDPA